MNNFLPIFKQTVAMIYKIIISITALCFSFFIAKCFTYGFLEYSKLDHPISETMAMVPFELVSLLALFIFLGIVQYLYQGGTAFLKKK